MNRVSFNEAMDRVKSASKDSPVAVFRHGYTGVIGGLTSPRELFEVVFADTVETQRRIASGDPKFWFIGYGRGNHSPRDQ